MNVLIIHAHPEPNSPDGALTRRAVQVSDLYAMG